MECPFGAEDEVGQSRGWRGNDRKQLDRSSLLHQQSGVDSSIASLTDA